MAIIESHPFLHFGCESERICGNACGFLHVLFFSSLSASVTQSDLVGSSPLLCAHQHLQHKCFAAAKEGMDARTESQSRIQMLFYPRCKHTTADPDTVSEKLSSCAQSLMMRTEEPACIANTHTHTCSILPSQREDAQSRDLSLGQRISAPWTETRRQTQTETETQLLRCRES